ncbi:MAG TPA: ABC transporter permease subunit [Candidatus Dormibacteraeota bacterium]|nr:ABC transporter permease subunit [Candidatus Dormibacteraeota bacterium]
MAVAEARFAIAHQAPRSRLHSAVRAAAPKLTAVAVLLAVWQLVVILHLRPGYLVPGPRDVWSTFAEQWREGHVLGAVWTSLSRSAVGFAIAVLIGTPLGLLMARVALVRLAAGSLVAALQSLPSVVWVVPGLLLLGPSPSTILFVVVMGAAPSVALGLAQAVEQTPPLLVDVGRAAGARGLALYRHVLLPAAFPGYVAGLRQAWSFAWRSLMAAELITQSADLGLGLGQLLDSGRQTLDMSLSITAILLILAVGVAVDALVFSPLSRGVNRRRGLLEVRTS